MNVLPSITMWGLGCLIIDRDWNLIFDTTALLCTAKRWDSTVKYFNSNIFFIKKSTRLLWILSVPALAIAMKNEEIQSKSKPFLESPSVGQWPTSQPEQMKKTFEISLGLKSWLSNTHVGVDGTLVPRLQLQCSSFVSKLVCWLFCKLHSFKSFFRAFHPIEIQIGVRHVPTCRPSDVEEVWFSVVATWANVPTQWMPLPEPYGRLRALNLPLRRHKVTKWAISILRRGNLMRSASPCLVIERNATCVLSILPTLRHLNIHQSEWLWSWHVAPTGTSNARTLHI